MISITNSDVEKLIKAEKNINTKRKTDYGLEVLGKERNENRKDEKIPASELDGRVRQYVWLQRQSQEKTTNCSLNGRFCRKWNAILVVDIMANVFSRTTR